MTRPVHLLIVEDNPGDVDLILESISESKIRNKVSVVADGEEAIAFMRREGAYADAERPDLVFLDFNLPRMNGREVLSVIKSDPEFAQIPVIVLTSSDAPSDVARSYELHANAFVTKPLGFEEFVEVVKSIETFWFTIVKLPSGD